MGTERVMETMEIALSPLGLCMTGIVKDVSE